MKVCSWNISKGLIRKLADAEFQHEIADYDILCFNECWVKCPKEFEIAGYEKNYVQRKKCNGGGVIVFHKKWLNSYLEVLKCCADSMIWLKISNSIMSDCKDLYLCAIYVPPDKNIFYRKYDCDVFEVLQEHIEHYGALGNIAIIGDLNGRIGKANDFIGHDLLSTQLQSDISGLIDYTPDSPSERTTEDIKPANTFGRKILDLCKSSGVRVCNGRFGKSSGKFTFQNKNGCSVIDYVLLSHESFSIVNNFMIGNFNTFSCHAPVIIDFKLKGLSLTDFCSCKIIKYNTYNWNEEYKDDIKRDLCASADKISDLVNSMNETDNIDDIVAETNDIFLNITEKYTKREVIKTVKCDYCNGKKRNLGVTGFNRDKPWINDECKELYRTYKRALSQFNLCRSEENRLYLNISKQRFKRMENTLKRRYKTQRGDMFSSMRRTNPKYFYRKFRRKRKTLNSNLTLDDFVTHFKNLVSKDSIIDGQVNDENYDVVYSELDRPFTEQEIDICVKKLKREKAPGNDNILNDFIKESKTVLLPLQCKLFNVILCTDGSQKYGLLAY